MLTALIILGGVLLFFGIIGFVIILGSPRD